MKLFNLFRDYLNYLNKCKYLVSKWDVTLAHFLSLWMFEFISRSAECLLSLNHIGDLMQCIENSTDKLVLLYPSQLCKNMYLTLCWDAFTLPVAQYSVLTLFKKWFFRTFPRAFLVIHDKHNLLSHNLVVGVSNKMIYKCNINQCRLYNRVAPLPMFVLNHKALLKKCQILHFLE